MAIYTDTKIAQGPFLFISGQTPSQDGAIPEDPQEQTTIVLKKIEQLLSANQLTWSSVVKMTVFLTDAAYLAAVRTAFTTILAENKPAMSLVIVAGLVAPEFKVEIEAQATMA